MLCINFRVKIEAKGTNISDYIYILNMHRKRNKVCCHVRG